MVEGNHGADSMAEKGCVEHLTTAPKMRINGTSNMRRAVGQLQPMVSDVSVSSRGTSSQRVWGRGAQIGLGWSSLKS